MSVGGGKGQAAVEEGCDDDDDDERDRQTDRQKYIHECGRWGTKLTDRLQDRSKKTDKQMEREMIMISYI